MTVLAARKLRIRTMTSSGWEWPHSRESWHAHTYITSLHKICYCRLLRTSNHAPSPDPKSVILSKEVKGSPPRKWSQQGKHCHKLFPGTHIPDLSSPLSPVSLSPVCVCVFAPDSGPWVTKDETLHQYHTVPVIWSSPHELTHCSPHTHSVVYIL